MNMLPSRAYCVSFPISQAIVVRVCCLNLLFITNIHHHKTPGAICVFYHSRFDTHLSEKCWLLITGYSCNRYWRSKVPTVFPYISLEDLTSGSNPAGILNSFNNSSSHLRVWILYNIVLEALETSVICNCPLVRFHTSQVSTVPKAADRLLQVSWHPSHYPGSILFLWLKICIDNKSCFIPDHYAVSVILKCIAKICCTPVLPDNRIINRFSRFPVPYYGVSRWFVIPIAEILHFQSPAS